MARRRRRRRRVRRNPGVSTWLLLGGVGVGAYLLLRKKTVAATSNGVGRFGTIEISSGVFAPAVPTTTVHRAPAAVTISPAAQTLLQQLTQPVQASLLQPTIPTLPAFQTGVIRPDVVPSVPVDQFGPVACSMGGPYTAQELQAACAASGGVSGTDSLGGPTCTLQGATLGLDVNGCVVQQGAAASGGLLSNPLVLGGAALAALMLLR